MVFTKDIIEKLIDAWESENEMDPKVIAKVRNVAGPGVFYALQGHHTDDGRFVVFGLTNIDFSGSILEQLENAEVYTEDFDTFNIPYGHVIFELDRSFNGRVSDAKNELNA